MSHFVQTMNSLRAYHKARLTGRAAIAPHMGVIQTSNDTDINTATIVSRGITMSTVNGASDVSPEAALEIEALKAMSQKLAEEQNKNMEVSIINDAQALSNEGVTPGATEAFKQKMNLKREREKHLSAQNIDKIFDSAIEIGERHPAAQEAIVTFTELVTGLFREMSRVFNEFLAKVLSKVITWVKTAFQDIKNTFGNIGDWIQGWFVRA
ncbi:hypothetical protein V466_22025 [Pseudomonas mandelii PD30]|uniref:Uncharacterized protein n=1 Tax=Pseudomonas mandelii PD30 TaxID=1419583 RepID=A0A059KYA4_9PSED|nr:hypothetical protein [Pseudomonas mandelii]KDD66981.1 hypothetical protein V466_22025 [Pseudomonas mandelii PD30]